MEKRGPGRPPGTHPQVAGWEKFVNAVAEAKAYRDAKAAEATEADEAFHAAVRAAFAAGVTVGPLVEVTGLSSSRVFQIKHGHSSRRPK